MDADAQRREQHCDGRRRGRRVEPRPSGGASRRFAARRARGGILMPKLPSHWHQVYGRHPRASETSDIQAYGTPHASDASDAPRRDDGTRDR